MTVGKIENGLERGFVKHRLNCLLITDPLFPCSQFNIRIGPTLKGVLNKGGWSLGTKEQKIRIYTKTEYNENLTKQCSLLLQFLPSP